MKQTRILMGMPITVEVIGDVLPPDPSIGAVEHGIEQAIETVFSYFTHIDEKFSTYKSDSEITRINKGLLTLAEASDEMKIIFALSEETKRLTDGYFDIVLPKGERTPATKDLAAEDFFGNHTDTAEAENIPIQYEPSGLVKGWAIWQASGFLRRAGFRNFFIEAGGDIQASGRNMQGERWSVGIRDPFDKSQQKIVKKILLGIVGTAAHGKNEAVDNAAYGIATSGTYVRGQHIFNPKKPDEPITDIVSLTVIGSNVYEADRFATAAFAMGRQGIHFIERLRMKNSASVLEAYLIDATGIATMTSGFDAYVFESDAKGR